MIARTVRYVRRHARRFGPAAWLRALRERTSPYACPVCERRIDLFLPLHDNLHRLEDAGYEYARRGLQTLHWNAYSCPHCGATDRDRLMALYLASRVGDLAAGGRMLDIAPSRPLIKYIQTHHPGIVHRTADLHMKEVDDRIDVADMSIYPADTYRWIICSHVLEHVEDDRRAMSELWRVLEPGGWAMILVPIDLSLTGVLEGPTADEKDRWRLYAQGDHVRMYSQQGLVQRLEEVGFDVELVTARELGQDTLYRAGVCLTSLLYVARKPGGVRRTREGVE